MTPTYSKRFLAVADIPGPARVTVPVGVVWVVRDIAVRLDALDSGHWVIVANAGISTIFYWAPASGQGTYEHWVGRQVLNAGETLEVIFDSADWEAAISGYELAAG